MTTAMNEAEKLADRLRDIVTKYRFVSHEHGVIDGAASILRRQAEQIKVLRDALGIAERFCGSLTSDECPDSVHVPIRAALAATKEAE